MSAFLVVWLSHGVATVYEEPYVGMPLYCDSGIGLRYKENAPSWVALDITWYESGQVRCGDTITIWGDGWSYTGLALDAGRFHGKWIEDWPELPIVADLPKFRAPFEGLSARVRVVNVSAVKRAMEGLR